MSFHLFQTGYLYQISLRHYRTKIKLSDIEGNLTIKGEVHLLAKSKTEIIAGTVQVARIKSPTDQHYHSHRIKCNVFFR
jgi:hypothetical protein